MQADRQAAVRDTLAGVDLFRTNHPGDIDDLVAVGQVVSYPRGATLFQKLDAGDRLMVVLEGTVRVSSVSIEGREAVITFVRPGELLGEIGTLDGEPRTADASALTEVDVFVVRRTAFIDYVHGHPDFALRLIQFLCQRLRRSTGMIEASVQLSMASRVAFGVLSLMEHAGRRQPRGWRLDFKLTQRDLGAFVGLARENVNRQLRVLEQERLLVLDKGEVVVPDLERLRARAEGGDD
ncbi:MAG: Crp/Fnr family transcriptional regulator [Pseudomonadota bacterium]